MKPDFSEVHQEKQGSICTGYSKGNYKRIQKKCFQCEGYSTGTGPRRALETPILDPEYHHPALKMSSLEHGVGQETFRGAF